MKFFKRIGYILSNFRSKYKISVRNPHNDKEVWYIYLSPLNIFTATVAFIVVVFTIIMTTVTFTPIMDYIPGYPGNKTRNMLIENNMRLDSLEHQLNLWNNYYDNVVRIMDGKAPLVAGTNTPDTTLAQVADIPKVEEDSILRMQMENNGIYKLQSGAAGKGSKNYTEMLAPIKGLVKGKFDPKAGNFGINIATGENQPVMSVMEGTVIYSSWSPTEGNVIYVLHPGNIVSAYLHNARLMKKTGDRVSSGEVIAFTGSSLNDKTDKGFIEFQLWYNGSPVNPENYIVF